MMPVIEIRANSIFISGFVNITEKESHFLNEHGRKFKEIVQPKTWSKALSRAKDVMFLHNHQEDRKLGSLKDGNMKLLENEVGLKIEAEIFESDIVQKAKENRSFLSGFSFGFIERSSEWRKKDGYDQRILSDVDLLEVSLLSGLKPAYPSATVMEVRSSGILERRYTDFQIKEFNVDSSLYQNKYRYLKLKGLKI